MRLSYVALPLLSSALLLVACGDDASNGSGGSIAGSGGASGKSGTSKGGSGGSAGGSAGTTSKGGSAGSTSKGGSGGGTSKGGSGGGTSKGGSAGSTSKGGEGGTDGEGGEGGEGGSASGGKAGTSTGGKAGSTSGGAAGSTSAGAAGAAGTAAGGEAGRAGEGGSDVGGAAGTSAGGEGGASAGGTSAGGEAGASAGGSTAGGAAGTSAGGGGTSAAGNGGTAAGGTSAGGTSSGGAGGAPPVVCRELTVTKTSATAYDDRIVLDFANIGAAARDAGGIFLDEKPAVGDYQLGAGLNANPNTAKQLVTGYEDLDAAGKPAVLYMSTKGTLGVSVAASTLRVKGTLTDVTLSEATVVGDDIVVKPGGQCLHIATAAFDTSTYCANNTDCSASETCDPATNRCKAPCQNQAGCAAGQSCVAQETGASVGACYSTCRNTAGATCGGASTCSSFNFAGDGYCIAAGKIPAGGACAGQTDTTTDCAPGLVCAQDVAGSTNNVCRSTCANADGTPGCPSGQLCLWEGYCSARNDVISPAQVGQACAVEGQGCNADLQGPLGICFTSGLIPQTVCRQVFHGPKTCPAGTTYAEVTPGRASNGGGAGTASGVCVPNL